MEKPLHILFVSADPEIATEAYSALAGVHNWRTIPYFASDTREALETALNRNPQLICLEMTGDTRELITFAKEIRASLPETIVVAMYDPHEIGREQSESAVIIEVLRANVQDFLRRPLSSTECRQLLDRVFTSRTALRPKQGLS